MLHDKKCGVTRPLAKKINVGLEEGEWKSYFYKHKLSFKHKGHSNKTTLQVTCGTSVSSETPNLKWYFLRCPPALLKCLE